MTVQAVVEQGIENFTQDQADTFLKVLKWKANNDPEDVDERHLQLVGKLCDRLAVLRTIKRVERTIKWINRPTSEPEGLTQPGSTSWN